MRCDVGCRGLSMDEWWAMVQDGGWASGLADQAGIVVARAAWQRGSGRLCFLTVLVELGTLQALAATQCILCPHR
jgi:hypothetical protein